MAKSSQSQPTNSRIPIDVLEQLLREHYGNISTVAEELGLPRARVYERIRKSPRLQSVLQQARETIKDIAERNIFRKVMQGDIATSQWLLARLARERGYGDKIEQITTSTIEVELSWGDEDVGPSTN
jgi:hypothetical protein